MNPGLCLRVQTSAHYNATKVPSCLFYRLAFARIAGASAGAGMENTGAMSYFESESSTTKSDSVVALSGGRYRSGFTGSVLRS